MNSGSIKNAGKSTLPFIIASVICGYANDSIPAIFPEGDLRNWAYRSIPFLSICVLFCIRVIRDVGAMSVSQIIFSVFCAKPEKKTLRITIDDTYASEDSRKLARARYDEIIRSEMNMNAKLMNYLSKWFKHTPISPELPSQNQKD
ncbi:hypothetical protein D8682_01300 [Buttiauxella sp. 3AFRM03]|uniref:hypothetical protein n=1 Tax=Buttiauxella sp. 3AFRM03 TaxID=2479367 RepID=UPI000EF79468|nr:hypothetical protein [Buttiauxella sp. 3AFRM03]AYN25738.1 hypothetical protein D8682_01300 [Buttiauxella sp. 3AFRM03]